MFEEIICTFTGHKLEKESDRDKGPLPSFKCSRCGTKINKF
jgi:hypothetical protein